MTGTQIQEIERVANRLLVHIGQADREMGRCLLYLLALHGAGDDMESVADWLQARTHAVTAGMGVGH